MYRRKSGFQYKVDIRMREFVPYGCDYENCMEKTREAFRKYQTRANEEAAAVATAAKSQSKNKRFYFLGFY